MGIGVGLSGDIMDRIIKRLESGWMLFYGPSEYYFGIEMDCYHPERGKNEDFEIITGFIEGKYIALALGKKEGKIVEYLDESKVKDTIAMECVDKVQGSFVNLTVERKGNKISLKQFINQQIYIFFKNLEFCCKNDVVLETMFQQPQSPKSKSKPKKKRKHISNSIRHEVFVRDGYKCVECGATKENTTLHIDHIIPVAQGGTDEMSNLQTLCEACNLAKSSRAWKTKE